jgi:murein DD-endopeptidase MepM/ murein hydrolase activator NlpD
MVARFVKIPASVRAAASLRAVAVAAVTVSLTATLAPAASATTPGATNPTATGSTTLTTPAGATPTGTVPGAAALQQKITHALAAYETARANVARVSLQSARLTDMADQATATATRLRKEVGASEGGSILDVLAGLVGDGESDLDRAAAAAADAEHAMQLAATVEQSLKDAIAETERARRTWELARADLQAVEARWSAGEAARAAVRRSSFRADYTVTDSAQDRRNRAALRRWHNYLRALGDAGIVPPAADRLRNPDRLPQDLEMLRDRTGRAVPGVATTDSARALTVLPSETVRAVSASFSRLGLAEVPGANSPSSYACGGLVAHAWGATTTLPADSVNQWRELRTVPFTSLQVGDVVVLGSKRSGLEQSGVYVGRRDVILADPKTGSAGVQALPRRDLYGVKRVNLPVSRTYDAPRAGSCGIETPNRPTGPTGPPGARPTGDGPFILPVADGAFTLSARFGAAGALWSSGEHSGLDFAAPTGTPVSAVAAGTVSVETSDWAGQLVRIDHGGGVETWYAHNSEVDVTSGERVRQGQVIAAVGNEGNSTGPHLHFEVRLDGSPVDPALVLDLDEPRPSYPNGEIPTTALCSATTDGAQLLRCDAAVSFRLMAAAYANVTGDDLCITDSYRSHAGQVQVFRTKPGLAAAPGTSVHGEALAVDLCGGVERFGTAEHLWMVRQGPGFGWHHPSWAAAGGSRPEPWHFEYAA